LWAFQAKISKYDIPHHVARVDPLTILPGQRHFTRAAFLPKSRLFEPARGPLAGIHRAEPVLVATASPKH
jgi:hypothetical protein